MSNKKQKDANAIEYISMVNQFAEDNNTYKPTQQTAVEWLVDSIMTHQLKPREIPQTIIEQAKAMEKEQHKESYWESLMSKYQTFEQYYKETYE